MAEKSATSSSVNCNAFILSAKSNMESNRKPALFVTWENRIQNTWTNRANSAGYRSRLEWSQQISLVLYKLPSYFSEFFFSEQQWNKRERHCVRKLHTSSVHSTRGQLLFSHEGLTVKLTLLKSFPFMKSIVLVFESNKQAKCTNKTSKVPACNKIKEHAVTNVSPPWLCSNFKLMW